MSYRIARAGADRIEEALPLVAAFHAEEGVEADDAHRRRALEALFTEPCPGAFWMIEAEGGEAAGYICVAFGWSIEFGGRDGFVDEFYVAPAHRGRGAGRAALRAVADALAAEGLAALHLEVEDGNRAMPFYESEGFAWRQHYHLMSAPLGARLRGRRGARRESRPITASS